MSDDPKPKAKPAETKDVKAPPAAPDASKRWSLDERRLTFAEIELFAAGSDPDTWARELVNDLRDGRAIVRANAVLALDHLAFTAGARSP